MFKKSLYLSTAILFTSLFMSSASYGMLPEDIFYTPEGHSKEAINHHKIIGADVAHARNVFGEGVKVAVIDMEWFDCESDTKSALTETTKQRMAQFQAPLTKNESHSNLVASLIAGKQGIAPKVQLEVFSQPEETFYADYDKDKCNKFDDWIVKAIRQSIEEKADFINMSIIFGDVGMRFPQPIAEALYAARDAGIGIILCAGNERTQAGGNSYVGSGTYPNFGKIVENMNGHLRLAVATRYHNDYVGIVNESFASFSNVLSYDIQAYGLAAPGEQILSCAVGSKEIIWNGTSCSAPIITASAALVLSNSPHLKGKGAEVLKILDESARKTMLNPITLEEYRKGLQKSNFNNKEQIAELLNVVACKRTNG